MSGFRLEGEGLDPIDNPTSAKVRDVVETLGCYETSFAILTLPNGDYLQVAGDGDVCTIERRKHEPLEHSKVYSKDLADRSQQQRILCTGAGDLAVEADEAISLSDAANVFVGALEGTALPRSLGWRSMNEVLGL